MNGGKIDRLDLDIEPEVPLIIILLSSNGLALN
jgi:hypothetical protein